MSDQKVLVGYKVVSPNMESCTEGNGSVQYGQFWTQPKRNCGPLCLYSTLRDVENFIWLLGWRGPPRVFRCWYVPSKQTAIWESGGNKLRADIPFSTVLADSVYLGKELK